MKRSMMLFVSCIILSLVLIQSGLAQGRMRMSAEDRAKMLKERLSLTDEQTKQVQTIYEQSQKEMQDVFQKNAGDRDAMRKAMTDLAEKNDKEIEKVLTDEQKPKFEQFKKERSQFRRGGRMQNQNPPAPPKKDDEQ